VIEFEQERIMSVQITKSDGEIYSIYISGKHAIKFCQLINKMLCEFDASGCEEYYKDQFVALNLIADEFKS
jgi:hypothetical protein